MGNNKVTTHKLQNADILCHNKFGGEGVLGGKTRILESVRLKTTI